MKQRGVVENSAFALAGDLVSKAGLLVVMMVAARGLPTAEFAVFATCTALATVLAAVLDGGSQTLLTRDGVAGPVRRGELLRALAVARLPLLLAAGAIALILGAATGRPLEAIATVLLAAAGAAQQSLTGALRSAQDLRPEATAKLTAGVLELAAAGVCVALAPRAGILLLALAASLLCSLVPLLPAARRAIGGEGASAARDGAPAARDGAPTARDGAPAGRDRASVGPRGALRLALPLGAMTLATMAYYRSGTIWLSAASTPSQTARFATASTFAWGMLCVGNAVTTGLLPRLSAAISRDERAAITRRALVWLTAVSTVIAVFVIALARPLLELVFGGRYGDAAGPLIVLAVATVLIAPAGVLGTALIAERRVRVVGVQVGASLLTNIVVLALAAPVLGATGAALATLSCEVVGLALLGRAVCRPRPSAARVPLLTGLEARPSR